MDWTGKRWGCLWVAFFWGLGSSYPNLLSFMDRQPSP